MEEHLIYPQGYIKLELPEEEPATSCAIGYGGVASIVPAKIMKANFDLNGLKAPLRYGAARDSCPQRAEWLSKISRIVTYPAPDRMVSERGERLLARLFGFKRKIKEVNRPPLFEMIGGGLPARVQPYGHRPDIMAEDFHLWKEIVENDTSRIVENMLRRGAPRGSLAIAGRSVGSHEMPNAYAQYLLKEKIKPSYVISILPVFSREYAELSAYLRLIREWGMPDREVILFHSINPELGMEKSDIALSIAFFLNALVQSQPDIITIIERARSLSPFLGETIKAANIPIRTIEEHDKIIFIIPIGKRTQTKPEARNCENIIKTLISDTQLEISNLGGECIGIFIHVPFLKDEVEWLAKTYSDSSVPVLFNYGGTFGTNNLAEVYCVGIYVFKDSKKLPPYVEEIIGSPSLDEVRSDYQYMEAGFEILSKLSGISEEELFRREG